LGAAERFQELVQLERERQDSQWHGALRSPESWTTILGEEFGEVCRAVLKRDYDNLIEELVQVAAVAQAFFEQVDAEMKSTRR
jgi:MazG nucleotide pyrophosphohydrolase domain.